ncbi:UNVERIFIED_CONTAM: Transposon Ty3-G Gag-Pol polyprotein [Sesamum calycinum]|uniref:Transposon Ty3-G Gag-Pol polyprotein n=1 Tax=Sesamum calycinum TaxID=2727403 RepID=A0AAW2QLA3_9LAMI
MNEESQEKQDIVFGSQDLERNVVASNDLVVISATIANFWVKKVLVDSGSSADIIFHKAFSQMGINNAELTRINTPPTSFSRNIVEPIGKVTLPISLGSYEASTKMIKFLVKRAFGNERIKAIKEEVEKLLRTDYIRPVQYPEWLANVVLVPKPNGKWRMCIDFTDLNKACPKDSYPLPRIDALIDSTSGCELMSFLDAFQGYNQIRLDDQEKTSFVTDQGIFCYNVMPFGLKNVGATYQRLVNNMFREQIRRNMEVYIDDMVIKSQKKENHKQDLQDCFGIL